MASLVIPSVVLVLLIMLTNPNLSSSASTHDDDDDDDKYVRNACSVTKYKDLCIRSLSPFSSTAKNNPRMWARAGVSVTVAETKTVLNYFSKTRRSTTSRRSRVALSDCRELFQDSLDQLHMSLGVLRKLTARDFQQQMSDVVTWLSAALTDQDTCLDGFEGARLSTVRIVQRRVAKAMYLTSNSLALVNKLATSGL